METSVDQGRPAPPGADDGDGRRALDAAHPVEGSRARTRSARPTMLGVARTAGVSLSTVSRVMNEYPGITDETRRRVLATMLELGYVAHVSARALASGRTQMIGLLAQEIDNPFHHAVIGGADQLVAGADYDLLLCTTHARREKEAEYVARLSRAQVDGLLIVLPRGLPDYVEQLKADAFPFVIIDYDDEAPGCTVVNAANRAGTRTAIDHLIALGHRRIGVITGRPNVGATTQRLAGYRDALEAGGIPVDEALIVPGDFLEERGYDAARELFAIQDPPTAIFASNDAAAFGVLRAARDAGLAVPRDMSVIGFDDAPEASYVSPALTTVRQPLREMGREAVRQLLSLLADPSRAPTRVVLDTQLVVRQSTGPPSSH